MESKLVNPTFRPLEQIQRDIRECDNVIANQQRRKALLIDELRTLQKAVSEAIDVVV